MTRRILSRQTIEQANNHVTTRTRQWKGFGRTEPPAARAAWCAAARREVTVVVAEALPFGLPAGNMLLDLGLDGNTVSVAN